MSDNLFKTIDQMNVGIGSEEDRHRDVVRGKIGFEGSSDV